MAYIFGAVILIEYAAIVLFSLWIYPLDILMLVKLAFLLGYALLITQTAYRIQDIFDKEAEMRERLEAILFIPATLIAIIGALATLPELLEFFFSVSLPLQVSLGMHSKAIISIGMLVILAVPITFIRVIGPDAGYILTIARYGISKRSWEVMQRAQKRDVT